MSNNFGYIDIILLGMIAGFIILRLRSILGRKTGHEPKIYPSFSEKKFNVSNNELKKFKQNHEKLEGHKTYGALPPMEDLALYHPKTIDRQEKQNNYYNTL